MKIQSGWIKMILVSSIGLLGAFGTMKQVYAVIDTEEITKKTLIQSLLTCYNNTYTKREIDARYKDVELEDIFEKEGTKDGTIKVAGYETGENNWKGLGNTLKDGDISCKQVFVGYSSKSRGKIDGLYKSFLGLNEEAKDNVNPETLGYKGTEDSEIGKTSQRCLSVSYKYPGNGSALSGQSNKACFAVKNDGVLLYGSDDMEGWIQTTSSYVVSYDDSETSSEDVTATISFRPGDYGDSLNFDVYFNDKRINSNATVSVNCRVEDVSNVQFDDIYDCLNSKMPKENVLTSLQPGILTEVSDIELTTSSGVDATSSGKKWIKGGIHHLPPGQYGLTDNEFAAAQDAMRYFTGNNNKFDSYFFTEQDRFDILNFYVARAIESNNNLVLDLDSCYSTVDDLGDDYGVVNSGQWCRIVGYNMVAGKYNVVNKGSGNSETGYRGFETVGFETVLKQLKEIDVPELSTIDSGISITGDEPVDDDQDLCYGGSGSLGWIICPIITAADGVGRHMWEQIENYHLKIPASEIFKSGGGVETGWGVVRNIANTLFIVLFLVVIFSQLTGWGIDNYGIKKILPRLIVIAILMNLSYLICQIAVDLSNIFGMGLNSMFSDWAGNIESAASGASGGAQAGAWILSGILGGGGIVLFSALRFGSFAGGLAGIGIAVLGILIVIVVAMLTLYLILIAREAGIVLCIIVAPVAIVCYALPNTEKLAKKWFDLFKALLVVYPICGAMVGGGQLAGSILASIPDNPGMKVAAMIIQVLPFFLVPTLLRSSLSLMGNVGTRLSTLGRSLGRRGSAGARGAIRNSERFKDFSQYRKDNAQERRARRTREGVNVFGRRIGGLANRATHTLTDRQRDRLSKANEIIKAAENRRQQASINAQNDVFMADLASQRFQNEESGADRLMRGDADYIAGKSQANRLQREDDMGKTLLYTNADYVAGKSQANRLQIEDDLNNTDLYNSADYVRGRQAQSRLRQENEREGTVLYTRPGFEESRRKQYEAQRRSEIKKMYGDRYANLDKKEKQRALIMALSGNGIDAEEQVDAAVDALLSTGDVSELLDALHGVDFSTMNAGVRDKMVAKAAVSGNQLLKGWSKTGGTVNLQNYINDTTNGLKNYIATQAGEHAFDTADKDTLDFLANHGGANAMSDAMIGNILTSSANANQTAMHAAIRLLAGREVNVGATINAEGLTRISEDVASALGAANLRGAIDEVNKPGNETIKARVSSSVKGKLGIT